MKIARFLYKKEMRWGQVQNGLITPYKNKKIAYPYGHKFDNNRNVQFSQWYTLSTFLYHTRLTHQKIPLNKVRLLSPVAPSKVILVGLNYKDHAQELGMKVPKAPLIFLKPNTSVIGQRQPITYPQGVKRLDYEAELAVVIAKTARFIREQEVSKYIFGYTCLNDVTARDLQKKDIQWTRAKSFDTFCPLGPWLETKLDPANLKIKLYLNGRLRQNSSTTNFIFSVPHLVSFVSKVMTLLPGDVVSTGTPSGVGRMRRGDIVEVEIEGIGKLSNRVI